MKTRIFTYASLILSAAALLSCQKLEEVNEPLVATGTHSVIVTTDATRTVNGDMHTYFEDGDKMTVIYKRDGSNNYHANEYTYSASSGQFTGDASLSSRYSYNWWGIYPYSSSNTSATSVSVSIPVSQTQVGNDSKAALAGEGFPLVGKTNALVKGDATPQFNVSNVATVLDFKITNGSDTPLTVTKVEFTAPSGIAGTFSADLTKSTISWKAASSASKTVTLNVASGEAIANGAVAHFYVGAGPFSGAGSYTIEVTAKNAEGQTFVSSKTINGSLDCKSSTINTISHTFVPGAPVTEKTYKKVTTAPTDWSGTYLVVDENAKKAFAYNVSNSYATNVTISDGKIAYSSELDNIALRVTDAGLDHPNTQVATDLGSGTLRAYNVKTKGGQYIYASQSAVKVADSNSKSDGTTTYYHTFFYDNGVYMVSSGNYGPSSSSRNYYYSLAYSSSKFAYGQGKSKLAKVQLYKLSEGGDEPATKQEQTISFANSSVEWTLGDDYVIGGTYNAQTIDAKTTVTLSSSNTAVATISDGKIKIVGEGTTTIIATAAEDNTYYGASASYTLKISPAQEQPTTKTYTKVNSISEGTYIICGYESASGKKGTYVCIFPPVTATSSSIKTTNRCEEYKFSDDNSISKITTDNASIIGSEVKITKSGSNWLVQYDGKYMYYNNSTIAFTTSSSSAAQSISLSSGRGAMKSGSQEFYHSGSDKAFGYTANKNASNLMFFKLDEGSTPATKQDQSLSFTKNNQTITSDSFTLGSGTYNAPTLIGAMTSPVTWTSSQTSVATVSNNGTVTIVGAGTTTITASAPASDSYNAASASYELTVSPAPVQPTTKTYTKVSSLSEGTYIICGYESSSDKKGTYVCIFPPVTATSSSIKTTNRCEEYKFSDDNSISKITTDNASIIGSEVKITKSGSNWLVQYDGKYMYYNNSTIAFTTSSSSAAQSISLSSGRGAMKSGSQEFYHSGSDKAFGYTANKNASNLMFFKLDEGSTPDTPDTPAQSSLNIENKQLAAYLDAVEKQPYFSNNTFGSYSSYYTSSLMKSNKYYSGSSSSNRLDQPVPVVITWSGNATKIEVFTSSSKTSASMVASETFSSSSSASIYNLIPGQKYYYTATNGSTTVATGDFTPTGRRRMIKVSSSFDANHAANCRDFGGLPTVDGKHVKYGLIYRGSNIDGLLSDNDAKDVFLNTMKIKWDIDLRASNEKGSAPTLSGVSKGTQSYSPSFDDNNLRSKTKVAKTLKEIIDAINKDTPEPVYIHCRIGSDRTGYICLLVEALIGVTQNYCDTDYEITSFTGNVTGTRFRVDDTTGGGMYKSGIKYFADFSGTTLHDKVYNFVTSSDGLNISKDDVDKFISRMKE